MQYSNGRLLVELHPFSYAMLPDTVLSCQQDSCLIHYADAPHGEARDVSEVALGIQEPTTITRIEASRPRLGTYRIGREG